MPKLEPKAIQKELESGKIRPVYWLYGAERMKMRELLRRLRGALNLTAMNEETLDGSEVKGPDVLDAALSLGLGGGTRLVVVTDAHALKEPEAVAPLFDVEGSVTVFLSKDLDARKKFSKMLVEKAAVVSCEEVPDDERESWIGYLAGRRKLGLPAELVARLRALDPWSLDIVDQELEKYSLALEVSPELASQAVQAGSDGGSDGFFDAFFSRSRAKAHEAAARFADKPEESIPLLGLLAWNTRHLALAVADREKGTRNLKLSPFLADRFNRWSRHWKLDETVELNASLAELDFGVKQTPKLPLGFWAGLVGRYCVR